MIGGFDLIPKEQRSLYDQAKISQDQRNAFLLWALIMAIGAALAYWLSPYLAIAAFVIWLLALFKKSA